MVSKRSVKHPAILTAKKVLKIKETRTKQNSDENVKKR